MTVSLSSPVTGATETSFTNPTYTFVSDQAPDNNARQYAVTALGYTDWSSGSFRGCSVHYDFLEAEDV